MKYKIIDWAGNLKYNGQTWDTFDDAMSFLMEDQRKRNPDASDDELNEIIGEFYVEEAEPCDD